MSTKRRLLANSTSGLVGRLVNVAVQVWLYQYLIKRISPAEYSLYPVVMAILVFVPPLTVILTAGIARNTVEAHARHDDQRVTEITSTLFPVLLAAGLGIALVGLVAAKYLSVILKIAPDNLSEARLMLILLFASTSFRLILAPFGMGLYICEKFVVLNLLTMLQAVVRAGLLFGLLLGAGPRVLWIVVATVAADSVFVLITIVLSVRAVPTLKFRFDHIRWGLLSGLISFGAWNMIGAMAQIIRTSSDVLILNRFATPIDVNTFQLASLPNNHIDAAESQMMQPLQPFVVARHSTGGPAALQDIYLWGSRYYMWTALLVATPVLVFREQLWALYLGSRFTVYADVPVVMALLLARYWIHGPMTFLGWGTFATGRVRKLAMLTISTSVFNVVITIYFVHFLHMGAIGSALGTLTSILVFDPVLLWLIGFKLLGMKFGRWLQDAVWRALVPSAAAGLFAVGWRHWMRPHSISQLVLAVAAVVSVYVLSILLFCMDERERRTLKQIFAKVSLETAFALVAPRSES